MNEAKFFNLKEKSKSVFLEDQTLFLEEHCQESFIIRVVCTSTQSIVACASFFASAGS